MRNGRQRTSVLAEARARFEAGDADSCGAPAERRRGSEEELRGGEALDNLHGSSAKRTLPRRVNGPRGRGGACYWLSGWLEQPQTKRKELCSPPVSEEAEVADAHKTARQQMQEEAAKELFDRQGHEPLLVAVSRVSPTESDVALGETHQPAVGDGDAMSVSAEIAQHVFWTTEGRFGVDNPVVTEQHSQPGSEGARFHKR